MEDHVHVEGSGRIRWVQFTLARSCAAIFSYPGPSRDLAKDASADIGKRALVHEICSEVARRGRRGGIADSSALKFGQVLSALRTAFFRDCRDIGRWHIQCQIAEPIGIDLAAIERRIHCGKAFADLASDYQDADKTRIEGSRVFVLNEGRQKLYGNVGFHLIEANIQELLRSPNPTEASWC